MTTKIELVHTIFKTHLDLGFTDLAGHVADQYFATFIPRALQTAEILRQSGRPERFVWTTGAWLIYEYLEGASAEDRQRMETAIEAGDISWHAIPYTMHCELLDPSLFRLGLGFSQVLDRRFGRQTIAAKMTDVPGHTRGIVPLLAEAGVEFLHIGVNEASSMPDVPPLFVWRDPDGAELVVMYQHAYGDDMMVPGLAEAITFAHTPDNIGPQTADQVVATFQAVQERFPGAHVMGSTLDQFAHTLREVKPQLPVITAEIGDSWIHGVGSDPKKVSQFRELARLRREWLARSLPVEDTSRVEEFSRRLLLVAEHTWGMDIKTHLADEANFSRSRFDVARAEARFQTVEASWAEQRGYVSAAMAALGESPLAPEAAARLRAIEAAVPDLTGYEPVTEPDRPIETGQFQLRFDLATGALTGLRQKENGYPWADDQHRLGWVRYQTFAQADYDRFLDQYLARRPPWAEPDFSKPGLAGAGGESRLWQAALSGLWRREDNAADYFILQLALPDVCHQQYGGPEAILVSLEAPRAEPVLRATLQWFQKPANRQPEAMWLSFRPRVPAPANWQLEKLGQMVSPLDVISKGNRKLHAVESGVFYRDEARGLAIETLDAPLVAPGEPSLLNFNNKLPELAGGMHFNLYNNVWGTNFPQWYEDDARFRFVLRFHSSRV